MKLHDVFPCEINLSILITTKYPCQIQSLSVSSAVFLQPMPAIDFFKKKESGVESVTQQFILYCNVFLILMNDVSI